MAFIREGRRRKGDGNAEQDTLLPLEPRDSAFYFRCTDGEAAAVRTAARQAGMTVSGFLRVAVRTVINGER